MAEYRNPVPTVDAIIEIGDRIVLIERKNPPYGWALPGGFVDYGECLEDAVVREAKEETGLDVELIRQMHTYSDPRRDARQHTLSTVYVARASGEPRGMDDAARAGLFNPRDLPEQMAFDHREIIGDYLSGRY